MEREVDVLIDSIQITIEDGTTEEILGKLVSEELEKLKMITDLRKTIVFDAYLGKVSKEEYNNNVSDFVSIVSKYISYLKKLLLEVSKYNSKNLKSKIEQIINYLENDVMNITFNLDEVYGGKLRIVEEDCGYNIYANKTRLSYISRYVDKGTIDRNNIDNEIEFSIIEKWLKNQRIGFISHCFSCPLWFFDENGGIYDQFCFEIISSDPLSEEEQKRFPGFHTLVSRSLMELVISNYRLEKIKHFGIQKYLEDRLSFLSQNKDVRDFDIYCGSSTDYKRQNHNKMEFITLRLMNSSNEFYKSHELPFFSNFIFEKLMEYGKPIELNSCLITSGDAVKRSCLAFGNFKICFDFRSELINIVEKVVESYNEQVSKKGMRRVLTHSNKHVNFESLQIKMDGF